MEVDNALRMIDANVELLDQLFKVKFLAAVIFGETNGDFVFMLGF